MNNVLQVLVAVLNSLWQTALAAALVWLALKFLRINAATRYIIWWATLAVVLVLPIAPRIVQALRPNAKHSSRATGTPVASPSVAAPTIVEAPAIVTLQQQRSATWPLWVLALWGAVFLFRMTQIVRSYFYLRGVKRRSAPSSQSLPAITRSAKLLLSPDVSSPMAVGFLKPAVILPTSLSEELETSELEHVLLHETAHIARNDDWSNLAARVLGAALALHPVAVWILWQIEQEREMACDDWVVARTGAAKPYAQSLAHMFELRWSRRRKLPDLNLASGIFGSGSRTGERIERLLKRGREFSPRASAARVATSTVLLLTLVVAGSHAPRWIVFAQRPAFEVASIKPFVGSTRVPAEFHLRPDGSLTVLGYPLQNLIANAYGIREEQIIGRRAWMNSARFSIDASAPGNPGKRELMRMLQTLLEDKFKVKVHRETKELPVFTMTAAKGGLKLDQKEEGCAAVDFHNTSVAPSSPRICGVLCNGGCFWRTDRTDMAGFTDMLSTIMRRPVIDKTGFAGTFSLHLEWKNDEPSTFTAALEERLGLQLTPGTGDVDFLVIDEVENPYEN